MAGLSPAELENYIGSILLRPFDKRRRAMFCVVGKQPNAPEGLTVDRPLPAPVIIRNQLGQVAGTGWAVDIHHRNLYPKLAPTRHDPNNVLIMRGVDWMANHPPGWAYAVGCHVFWDNEGVLLGIDCRSEAAGVMNATNPGHTYPTWPNIQAFYDKRGGERSGEADFGVHHWANPNHNRATAFDRWRVSVVADTGDVYAIDRLGGEVMLLGTLASTEANQPQARDNHRAAYPAIYSVANRVFEGWAEGGGAGRNLGWFGERITGQEEVR